MHVAQMGENASVPSVASAMLGLIDAPVFLRPTRDGDESTAVHHSDPFLLETYFESELDEPDPDDSSLPASWRGSRFGNISQSIRTPLRCLTTPVSGSPDSRGPPDA